MAATLARRKADAKLAVPTPPCHAFYLAAPPSGGLLLASTDASLGVLACTHCSSQRVLWVDAVEVIWVAILATCVATARDDRPDTGIAAADEPGTQSAQVDSERILEDHTDQEGFAATTVWAAEDAMEQAELVEGTPAVAGRS